MISSSLLSSSGQLAKCFCCCLMENMQCQNLECNLGRSTSSPHSGQHCSENPWNPQMQNRQKQTGREDKDLAGWMGWSEKASFKKSKNKKTKRLARQADNPKKRRAELVIKRPRWFLIICTFSMIIDNNLYKRAVLLYVISANTVGSCFLSTRKTTCATT